MNLYDNQPLTVAELRRLQALENRYRNAAREVFTNRVEYYHRFTGGHYTSITIRDQKTRWGSCSSRGTLSFNYRLIYGPAGPLDYVVVHELCHLTHMNHSKDFWNMVERIMPDYRIYKQWLREHGQERRTADTSEKAGHSHPPWLRRHAINGGLFFNRPPSFTILLYAVLSSVYLFSFT